MYMGNVTCVNKEAAVLVESGVGQFGLVKISFLYINSKGTVLSNV